MRSQRNEGEPQEEQGKSETPKGDVLEQRESRKTVDTQNPDLNHLFRKPR